MLKSFYKEIGLAMFLIICLMLIIHVKSADAVEKSAVQENKNEVVKEVNKENSENVANQAQEETGSAQEEYGAGQEAAGQEVIAPGQYPIMGKSSVSVEQMVEFFNESGYTYPVDILGQGGADSIEQFCQICYDEAAAEGVRAEVAFMQTMKETAWLQYGGDASIEQYNFAGIGTTGGGVPGNSYPDVRTGIRAQIQHLKAYATDEQLSGECVDDRYEYVKKGSAPYVEWLGQKENPEGLGWATAENYGYSIVDMINTLKQVTGNEH